MNCDKEVRFDKTVSKVPFQLLFVTITAKFSQETWIFGTEAMNLMQLAQ